MIVYIFGNPDLENDSLPLRLIPNLAKKFPEIKFEVKDPNEEWDASNKVIIIDTAFGIEKVTVFDSLEKFARVPRIGMHDFDALTNLRYLQKIGKIKEIKIIAVPPLMKDSDAINAISEILQN